jgi:hypothetical protein
VYNESNLAKAHILFLATLFTAILVSCSPSPSLNQNDDLPPLKENEFYAQNMETEKYYKVKAEIIYEGDKCVIWAEEDSGITPEKAEEIADKYDTIIRPKVVETFSMKNFNVKEGDEIYHFDNMLDYANALAGREDKKLTILLLDIKDNFKDQEKDSYVAGYFFGGNFYPPGKIKGTKHYSNGRDMIYVDTYPGLEKKPEQTYATFAHELQHLINFVTRVSVQMNSKYLYLMDTWVDEGLSSQAEYLYLEKNPPEKCEWFKEDTEGTIAQGNNFFVWDNHREKPLAILDDYATVYLFFRWLYLQADTALQSHIFLDIETSNYLDYRAVTNAAGEINTSWKNWETLLRTWLAANYYPKNSYGYTGDDYLQTITVKPIAEKTISLYPGEGVYSIINDPFSSTGTNIYIRYAGLANNQTAIITSPPYTGNVLLTFNANTSNTAAREAGSLTGVSPAVSPTAARNVQTGTLTGPFVLDARDMLERAHR